MVNNRLIIQIEKEENIKVDSDKIDNINLDNGIANSN